MFFKSLNAPISEAMLLPTLPASVRHMMLDENSSGIISRVVYAHPLADEMVEWHQGAIDRYKKTDKTVK